MNLTFLKRICAGVVLWLAMASIAILPVVAQTFVQTKNPIDLKITNVTTNGELKETTQTADGASFDGQLTKDDDIRYRYSGIDLNTKYTKIAASGGGYIKIYLNEVKETNFLIDQGLDNYPLKLNTIATKLTGGANKLAFVYVSSGTNTAYAPVNFSFNFTTTNNKPQINVLKPAPGSVFMKGVDQDFQLQLLNFKLTTQNSSDKTLGKIKVYFSEVKATNLLGTVSSGVDQDGKYLVNFKSSDLNFEKVPDSNQTKIIFALADTGDNLLNIQSDLTGQTNYNATLNVGLPRITIIEPKKDRSNNKIDNNNQFLLQIDNFEILKERQTQSGIASNKKGYLQIIVTNGDKSQPIQPIWGKTDFTLNEIGYSDTLEGQRTIKVQLVDQNFEILKPEATDSIEIFYTPPATSSNTQDNGVNNNSWRIAIITLTVVLIVGGISVLITRG
jgi:hypothetical protein